MAEMSPVRRRMTADMTMRNLSPATQRAYINAVHKFSRYIGRSPHRLCPAGIYTFQVHPVSTVITWVSLNQIVCVLRFFYGIRLGQDNIPQRIPYARETGKLPIILSADEVAQFLEAVSIGDKGLANSLPHLILYQTRELRPMANSLVVETRA
jgi:site-specific recombinase XerD